VNLTTKAPNLLRIAVREAEAAILCSRSPVRGWPGLFPRGMVRGSRLLKS
jgi:hypothetical protein